MTPYRAVLSSRFRMLLQYRAAALAGIVTQLFFGIVRTMIFDAFYRSSRVQQPIGRDDVVTYIWLGQAFLMLTILDADRDVAEMIRGGNVAYELVKPVDLYWLWFARAVSGRAAPLALRAVPILALAAFWHGLRGPASVTGAILFAVALAGGLLLAASLVAVMTISMVWTISGEGISRLMAPLVFFFSGIVVPLPLFPDWMQRGLAALPFRGLIDTPFRIYIGQLHDASALAALANQAVWIVVLVAAGRIMLARSLRRLVVHGG